MTHKRRNFRTEHLSDTSGKQRRAGFQKGKSRQFRQPAAMSNVLFDALVDAAVQAIRSSRVRIAETRRRLESTDALLGRVRA